MKFVKEKMIDIDDKDRQAGAIITDVPKMKMPMNWVCFILNVIIPGKTYLYLHLDFRFRNNDS